MLYVSKADLDTVLGANFMRQDLSPTISLTSTRPRPVSQAAPVVPATNTTHQWVEQGRVAVGAASAASFAQGALPNTNAIAPTRPQNVTCRVGLTAQVTDDMTAVWTGAGSWKLADGEGARMLQNAIDLETELVTMDALDQIEWMHISGDSTNPQSMAGGQTDGLVKWITASGVVVATGGTTASAVNFSEQWLKDGARTSAEAYPTYLSDTLLVPPELIPDINATIATGAGRPIVVSIGTDSSGTQGLTGGLQVGYYNTGFSVLKVKLEPSLSPLFNTTLAQPAMIAYNSQAVKMANLIKLGAEPLARTDTVDQENGHDHVRSRAPRAVARVHHPERKRRPSPSMAKGSTPAVAAQAAPPAPAKVQDALAVYLSLRLCRRLWEQRRADGNGPRATRNYRLARRADPSRGLPQRRAHLAARARARAVDRVVFAAEPLGAAAAEAPIIRLLDVRDRPASAAVGGAVAQRR